ncbi:ATP-binding cassette subfamily B protein [Herbinix hemicellulosilytica]|uniref:Putative ABC transporter ATP-binding protein YwjA n=1 Tax=Herbinix hemicellulosilytica TaxID=1564487 RepID=A0A0H5SI74_HERHM|nr:ABC transporter ATP-binding protein [Herbinix hemicellulosilytica]RBP59786.1 ATP-binding cassette subfamily B protein [Herbinix hemicellulosilytica]CRZ35174.1 putative ABC transporter ATP-binding protein YwjA [Herbinix hemicellulosilytica]
MDKKTKKFLSYYKPYLGLFIADMFFSLLASVVSLIYPMIVRHITNNILLRYDISEAVPIIVKLLFAMLGLAAVEFISTFFTSYKGHIMGAKIEYDMRNEIFEHFQKLSFKFYDEQKTGQLMSRITNDLFDVTELCHHGPEDIIISTIKFVGAFIILIRINLPLTLIVFAFLPLMFIFAVFMRGKMRRAFRRNRERIADINAQIEDNLSGIRVVKSFANESVEMQKFKEGNLKFVDSKKNSYWNMASFHSGLTLFTALINIAVIAGGGLFIANNIINVGDLLTFLLYINLLVDPVKKLINFTEQFQNGMSGFSRFYEILEIEPDIVDKPDAIELKDIKGEIEFKNVSFKYNEESGDVFKNINLKVEAGEYIALVGSSGVGKTTMCSLIPRFYEVSDGVITIDGIDIRDVKLKSLRKNIGIVQQDVYLFAGTVMDNIRYGKADATDEEVIQAAKNANAHDFIMELPNGYYTDIGQRGVKLSGGQKQRISIARVFLKNPPILIFDEATSALDNESEKVVQDSLEKLAKNRTTIVIAHRLSTIKNAKRIIVLTEDGIKETGTHDELLALNGIYAGLYKLAYGDEE